MMEPNDVGCAAKLSILADPTRLAVIELLLTRPLNVSEINDHLRIEQNLLSHHLRVLREAGLVTCSRGGRTVRYALSPDVELRSRQAIDLGCCTLSFANVRSRKNAL